MIIIIRKIINKLKKTVFYIMTSALRISRLNNKFNYRKQIHENEKAYLYFKKKYKKIVENNPDVKNTHKYSNIGWWCWLQGEDKAPKLNKSCLNSLKKNLIDRKIIIIDEKNYTDYINIPQNIIKKYEKGYIPKAHFSDLIRLELLENYGGTWIDSSVLCTSYDKNFFDKDLFVFSNWMKNDEAIVCSNWFITSEVGNPILSMTKMLLYKYWEEYDYLVNYYIFHIFFTISSERYDKAFKSIDKFSNIPPHILQFELLEEYNAKRFLQITNMSSIHKLTQKINGNNDDKLTYYKYIIENY